MPALTQVILYVKALDDVAAFYCGVFGYVRRDRPGDRIVELLPPGGGGAHILLHQAATTAKQGQAQAKLAFRVEDVAGFVAGAAAKDVAFGPIHDGGGYAFANAKDPAGNSVQVTSRP